MLSIFPNAVQGATERVESIRSSDRVCHHPDKYDLDLTDVVVNEYPAGYCKIAAVEDLDPNFSIYRKFGFLHHYALLLLQDELAELQDDLERFDRWEFSDGDAKNLISRRKDYAVGDSRRKQLITKLHSKLAQYGRSVA